MPRMFLKIAFVVLCTMLYGANVRGQDVPSFAPNPSVDPTLFLGERHSSWDGSIETTLVITKVLPIGIVYGTYTWGRAIYTEGGSVGFRAVIHDRTFRFGQPNELNFPYMEFTLNDDNQTLSATRKSMNTHTQGTFDKPLPVKVIPAKSVDPKGFAGQWDCIWTSPEFNSQAKSTLEVTSVDTSLKLADGSYAWDRLDRVWEPGNQHFSGRITSDSLSWGTRFLVEFTLTQDGQLKGSRYMFYGYLERVGATCQRRP